MAGTDGGFDAAAFREGIGFAMRMGAPVDAGEQVTFHFPNQLVYNTAAVDGHNVPFDPTSTVTNNTPPPLRVDCAVEYFDAENQPTSFGLLAPSRIAVTLLDVDYDRVKECAYVVVGGDRYDYRRTEPPLGLFDVGVYVMHFTSTSET